MDEKKIKFELSRVALIFVILFGLCILIWTFILGVWIGTKIGGNSAINDTQIAKKPELSPITPPVSNLTNTTEGTESPQQNATQSPAITPDNQTKPVAEATSPINRTEPKKEQAQVERQITEKQKKEVTTKPTTKEEPKYQKKEVAQLATKIKEETLGRFTIQVGAFSHKDKAELMRTKIRESGYSAEIREINQEGKTLYKVFLGRFSTREEAEKMLPIVKSKLGVDKPFIVELK